MDRGRSIRKLAAAERVITLFSSAGLLVASCGQFSNITVVCQAAEGELNSCTVESGPRAPWFDVRLRRYSLVSVARDECRWCRSLPYRREEQRLDVGWYLYISVCMCVCARAVSLAARRVLFPVSSEGAKPRRLLACL